MIVLYNPLSTTPGKQPLPLSLMALAAVLEASEPWTLVDGNLVPDPAAEIIARLSDVSGTLTPLLAVSVMPGPQLTQAVAVCARVKAALPHVPIVWGGYFPTQHYDVILKSGYVDYVVRGQGEDALLELVQHIESRSAPDLIAGIGFKRDGKMIILNANCLDKDWTKHEKALTGILDGIKVGTPKK